METKKKKKEAVFVIFMSNALHFNEFPTLLYKFRPGTLTVHAKQVNKQR